MSTLSRATIPKYVLNFFLWGPSAFLVAGSACTTGLSTLGGLVDNDHRREALRVCFTADVEANASEVGGGGRGEGGEGGGGGGGGGVGVEAGGEPMIFYTITYKIGLMKRSRISHKLFLEGKTIILLNKTPPHKETRQINQRTLKDW
ncbi:hypothetical protein AAZX31_U027300 [Glycine max]